MPKVINCECNEVVRAENDAELVEKIERHVDAAHPELVGKMSRDDILAPRRGEPEAYGRAMRLGGKRPWPAQRATWQMPPTGFEPVQPP